MSSVMFSPFTSIWQNKAAGTVITGQPGAGKSFFLLNVCANCLMMEQRIFAIDPKDDLGVLCDVFEGKVEYVDINNIEAGAMNPFKILENVDTNVISSLISIICGGLSDEQTIAITPIINDFVIQFKRKNQMVSFSDIADYLYANDNQYAQAIGTKLGIHRDSKYGPLIFGEEESKHHEGVLGKSGDNVSKIISLHGMELPKGTGKETEEQKFNSGIVFLICKMLREMLQDHGYPTLFVVDEAHIAYANPSFSAVIDEFLVLGRSLNCPTILASQSALHYPKTIAQLVSNKFCFKSSSGDAKAFLNLFYSGEQEGNADFNSIINSITSFHSGDSFYIDSESRSGIFHVTSLLGDDITSNPLSRKRKQ